jgi:hypothetical protein
VPKQNDEKKVHIRVDEEHHRQIRIRCADLDTIIQDSVVEMLERDLSANRIRSPSPARSLARREKGR